MSWQVIVKELHATGKPAASRAEFDPGMPATNFHHAAHKAKRLGMLDNVAAALQAMREHGYWIHDAIVQYALREAGEAE